MFLPHLPPSLPESQFIAALPVFTQVFFFSPGMGEVSENEWLGLMFEQELFVLWEHKKRRETGQESGGLTGT